MLNRYVWIVTVWTEDGIMYVTEHNKVLALHSEYGKRWTHEGALDACKRWNVRVVGSSDNDIARMKLTTPRSKGEHRSYVRNRERISRDEMLWLTDFLRGNE